MTIESDIYDTIKGLVGNRVFPDVAPWETARPYITYQQIGGQVIRPLDRVVPDKKHGIFQVNVWADTRAEAAAMALQVEAALIQSTAFICKPDSAPIANHEPDLNRYGTIQDFSIWSSR